MERLPVFSGEEIFRRLSESRSLPAGKKRVKLPAGRYFLEWPIILTAADNGLIFEGSGPEKTQLIGASLITGWHRQGKNFLAAYLAEVASGKWFFRHLYVNGSAAARSRLPETGYFEHESVFDVRWMSTSGGGWERKPTAEELGSLVYRKGDPGRWFDPASAEITLVHLWDESLVGVRRHDDSRRRIFFSNPAGHPAGAFGVRKYAIWNIREGLRRPGQWYLNRKSGQLVYWPRQHEKADAIEVLAPLLDTIVSFQGEEKQPVEEIVFQNLSLTATGSPLKAGGFGAREYPGAIELDNVRRCHFSELHIHSVGGQAIRGQADETTVENCRFWLTGAGGVVLSGRDNEIRKNEIFRIGQAYRSAIGLWLSGYRHKVVGNRLADTPYTAIACSQDGHLVAGNVIKRAVTGLTDGAAIYVTFAQRVSVRGNYVSQMKGGPPPGASAYYLDEQAKGCLVENNLAIDVDYPSHNHMAVGNRLSGNIFLNRREMRLSFPKCSGYIFQGNFLQAGGRILFTNPEAIRHFRDNFICSQKGKIQAGLLSGYRLVHLRPLPEGQNIFLPQDFSGPGLSLPEEAGKAER